MPSKNSLYSRLIPILVLFSSHAVSATSSYIDPSRILFERPDSIKQQELINCFTSGNCRQDDNKIRIYPMPCPGSGSKDCTGCYEIRGGAPVRVDDLNSAGTCAGVGSVTEPKLRVFVGYERICPAGTPVGDFCSDGQLLLSCAFSSEGAAGTGNTLLSYNRDCFSGRPYVRRARGVAGAVTVLPSILPTGPAGCPAGTTGIYPSCVPCLDNSYKPTAGPSACTACSSPSILNSETVVYTTAGTTMTSVNDCRVQDFTCLSGYTKDTAHRTCSIPPSPVPTPSPTPTPTLPPSPTPTPVATSTVTCPDPNFILALMKTEVGQIVSGVQTYNVFFDINWNRIFAAGDYAIVSFTRYPVLTPPPTPAYAQVHHFTQYLEMSVAYNQWRGTMSGIHAGDYLLYVSFFRYQGVLCPGDGVTPVVITVPKP